MERQFEAMEKIGVQELWSFLGAGEKAEVTDCDKVRTSDGHRVFTYLELAGKIAELQYRNRDSVLLFRGQNRDYKDQKSRTSLTPTMFRQPVQGRLLDEIPKRFEQLQSAEAALVNLYSKLGQIGDGDLRKFRILRWSVLQHYEVCPTPLLDFTHSLRIAASFASDKNETDEAFLYVVGVPNLSGSVTVSAEAGLQIVRLSSACPPSAVRPHIQEGYLLGEYPDLDSMNQRFNYSLWEVDFGRRLVAKFVFNPQSFWPRSGQFQKVGPRALYPSRKDDPLVELAEEIKNPA